MIHLSNTRIINKTKNRIVIMEDCNKTAGIITLEYGAIIKQNKDAWGWKDGAAVKSIGCSCRVLAFDFQHLHGNEQLSRTPVPRDPVPSSDLHGIRHLLGTKMYVPAKHPYTY